MSSSYDSQSPFLYDSHNDLSRYSPQKSASDPNVNKKASDLDRCTCDLLLGVIVSARGGPLPKKLKQTAALGSQDNPARAEMRRRDGEGMCSGW